MPNLGPEYDLAQRLARLERNLLAVTSQLAQAFSATQSDGSVGLSIQQQLSNAGATVTTWYQGPNTARDPNSGLHQALLYIGQLVVGGSASTSGVIAFRPNGKQIMVLGAGGFGLKDAQETLLIAPDETAGWGIATPWIPLPPLQNSDTSKWPATTSSAWTTIAIGNAYIQHGKIRWNGFGFAPTGVTGKFRLLVNGQQYGSVFTATGGFVAIAEDITLPAGSNWQAGWEIDLQAQVFAGTGTVSGVAYGIYGRGV
jgi:hypothetical protein